MANLVNSQWYEIGQRGLTMVWPLILFYFIPGASWTLLPHQYSIDVGIINLSEDFVTSLVGTCLGIILLRYLNKTNYLYLNWINRVGRIIQNVEGEGWAVWLGGSAACFLWVCVNTGVCLCAPRPPAPQVQSECTVGIFLEVSFVLWIVSLVRCKIRWGSISNHQ